MSDGKQRNCPLHSLSSYYVSGTVLGVMEPKVTKVKFLLFRSFHVMGGQQLGIETRQGNKSVGYLVLIMGIVGYQTGLFKSTCGVCLGGGR